ncbi:MAG: SAM-dependent DNA methyltransferase [Nanoarchaeota archaeon]|nr:SAM-dependent DNA methyltransferase [Nanoarchaeota archaeon]
MTISTTNIKGIQDIMRKDAGVDGDAQRISQLVWMIFLKVFDDKEQEWELDDTYTSPIPQRLRWRSWASDKEGITGDELLDFINNDLFKTLKELPVSHEERKAVLVKEVFEDAYNYMKSGTLLRQIVNEINKIDFTSSEDRHTFNDIYETILKDLQSAGNAGEFYTPRAVTQFIVDMVNPLLGERVMDPACGTGGFLICALEHLRKQEKSVEDRKTWQSSLLGIEKKQLPHMLCTTNMILHDVEIPRIRHDNSLSRPMRSIGQSERVEVVVMNPPFGGVEEDGILANFPLALRTKETADLFLVLVMQILKDRGRCGLVLPDGFLFGEGVKTRIKEKLLDEFNLHTIVRLPNGVFNPYTGITTNLLFFEKGTPTKEIWYFEHPYPSGVKSYNKTRPITIKEFDLEKSWWANRVENEHAWKVSIDDIRARNYNLDIKNPTKAVEEVQLSSKELLELLDKSIAKSKETLDLIKAELM